MTYHDDFTLSDALLEQLSTQGLGALPDLFPVLLNAAMPQVREVNGEGGGICQGWVITQVSDNVLLSLLSSSAYVSWDFDPALKGWATRRKPLRG